MIEFMAFCDGKWLRLDVLFLRLIQAIDEGCKADDAWWPDILIAFFAALDAENEARLEEKR